MRDGGVAAAEVDKVGELLGAVFEVVRAKSSTPREGVLVVVVLHEVLLLLLLVVVEVEAGAVVVVVVVVGSPSERRAAELSPAASKRFFRAGEGEAHTCAGGPV